jgi:small multidrug resistance pump
MAGKALAVAVTIAFSLLGVLGDYFLKVASADEDWRRSPAFYVGFVVYASTAFGWLFVMKHLKLGTIGVLYSMTMIVLLTTVGVLVFGERLSYPEVVGLLLALASLVLLVRFA